MFTGLIREIGRVQQVRASGKSRLITYRAPGLVRHLKIGDSVAVEGVCQTVTALGPRSFSALAVEATLQKTTLGRIGAGAAVNLEPALTAGDRLDGHIVQGHVSGMGIIRRINLRGAGRFLDVELSRELLRSCLPEGSVAVDGISLTIMALLPAGIRINLIPLTYEGTSLKFKKSGDSVNIETDILVRQGAAQNAGSADKNRITKEKLRQWGY